MAGPKLTASFNALRTRYYAGIKAVERGADLWQTFYLVLNPTKDVDQASRGELPLGYRFRGEEEVRAMRNAEARRHAEPDGKRWAS